MTECIYAHVISMPDKSLIYEVQRISRESPPKAIKNQLQQEHIN